MSSTWLHSLRAQIGLAVISIFLISAAALGYTLYALQLRQHDYLILNMTGQLRIISLTMQDQAEHYLTQAPDDYEKYDRDLGTYWQDLQKQIEIYDRIILGLESRQLESRLTGQHETVYCNFDETSRGQLARSVEEWRKFKAGLLEKLGDNLNEPRLTWGAEYLAAHGPVLSRSSENLAQSFQHMMEKKLDEMRLFLLADIGAGLALVLLVLYVLHRALVRPLDITMHGFERVARGDFNHHVPVSGKNEISRMATAFNRLTERINAMFRLTDRINQGKKLDEMLQFVHQEFQSFVPLEWVGVFYASPDGGRFTLERYCSSYPSAIKEGASFGSRRGALAAASELTSPAAISLDQAHQSTQDTLDHALSKDGMHAAVCLPLLTGGDARAVMIFASSSKKYGTEHIEFLANIAAMMSHILEKTVVMENLVAAAVQGLAKLAESRDPETGDHLVRMALYSALITEEVGREGAYTQAVTPAYVRDIFHFSPMHDIGKVGVRDDVLLKPGRLDAEERKEMERHAIIGGDVLRRAEAQVQTLGHSMFQVGIEIAECHHEKFDGSGYPAGRKGHDIPLSARIVAVADVFDALTSKRPYKDAWPIEKALSVMMEESGKHFDPEVISAMQRALPRMMEIYERHKHI